MFICGPQHHSPKGFHAPCENIVGPISKIIPRCNCAWIFGGITLRHYIVGSVGFE